MHNKYGIQKGKLPKESMFIDVQKNVRYSLLSSANKYILFLANRRAQTVADRWNAVELNFGWPYRNEMKFR